MTKLVTKTTVPPPKRYGITGTIAPREKAAKDPPAADHGEPSCFGSRPSSSRTIVASAVSGSSNTVSAMRRASTSGMPFET